MFNDVKLTIIVPCYNFEKYVKTCVDSILSQNINFNYEILIHDDKSTDNTLKIITENYTKYKNVKITVSEKNIGITKNLKNLFSQSKGYYIFTLDGDDYLTDVNYLQRAVDFLESNKDYVLYCSGYKTIYPDGKIIPEEDSTFLCGLKEDIRREDLFEINYVTFARVFRNFKYLIKDWVDDSIHEDWALNSEILKYGIAKCERGRWVGFYRITNVGRITSLTDQEKLNKNLKTIDLIRKNSNDFSNFIFHIHLFLNNEGLEKIAYENIKRIKEYGFKILITSPKKLPLYFYDIIDIFYHDKENQLLTFNYSDVEVLYQFIKYENMNLSFGTKEVQKHGLAVLRSMIKGCELAKINDIKYIIRIEFDDILGLNSLKNIKLKLNDILNKETDFLLIRNVYSTYSDISVHLMFYKCDKFLDVFNYIKNEKTYNDELKNLGIPGKHTMLETFIYLMIEFYKEKFNLKVDYDSTEIIKTDYFDTKFNIHQNCFSLTDGILSDVHYVYENEILTEKLCLATRNFSSEQNIPVEFIIKYKNTDEKMIVEKYSGGIGCWNTHILDNINEIDTIYIRNKDKDFHKKYKIKNENNNLMIQNIETNENSLSIVKYNN